MESITRSSGVSQAEAPGTRTAYDYIIVGAGSAGCVVARRLTEHTDARILVLEAGGSDEGIDMIANPFRWLENVAFAATNAHTSAYPYQPTPYLNNRVIYAPRGKVLGGSGSVNAMVWARGHRDDYDGWAAAGNPGWEYESVLPLFRKVEDWQGGETDFHGAGGPIRVGTPRQFHPTDAPFMEAAVSFGIPYLADTNGPSPEGVGPMSSNIADGRRCSPFRGYLLPVMHRRNLTVLTGAKVSKLHFEGSRCTGLDYQRGDQVTRATAAREVVLCAGAFETPRLLMRSGIGDAQVLAQLGIRPRIDLPGVGGNLQDHPLIAVSYEAREPLHQPAHDRGGSTLYWKSSPAAPRPDLMLIPLATGIATDEIARQYPLPPNAFSVFVTVVNVKSKGYLRMTSAAGDGPLLIQPNLLAEPEDREAAVRAVELMMDLAAQPALQRVIRRWVAPAARPDRRGIEAFIRDACSTYFHPVGTCAMGTGALAVVDNRLNVYGTEGLRIADASIMPQIPTANPHAPTLMIGEFAAELLLGRR